MHARAHSGTRRAARTSRTAWSHGSARLHGPLPRTRRALIDWPPRSGRRRRTDRRAGPGRRRRSGKGGIGRARLAQFRRQIRTGRNYRSQGWLANKTWARTRRGSCGPCSWSSLRRRGSLGWGAGSGAGNGTAWRGARRNRLLRRRWSSWTRRGALNQGRTGSGARNHTTRQRLARAGQNLSWPGRGRNWPDSSRNGAS